MGLGEERTQLGLDHARVHTFENGDHAFENHFASNLFLTYAKLDLAAYWKEEKIGRSNSVDGGHKGNRDAAANFADIIEMLHHLDQTKHRADDAHGRRKSAGGFEYFGNVIFVLGLIVEFQFHHLANFLG